MRRDPLRMKRKVQQLGSSTLAVTVPAEWARQQDLEKGDDIIVQQDENGGSLLLVPEQPSIEDTDAIIDVDALVGADALERAVVGQYVLGRQLIRVVSADPLNFELNDAVRCAEQRLMGLGVVEQNDSHITVRCSVAPGDFDLPTLLNRINRVESMIRSEAIQALVGGNADRVRHVTDRYEQVEKLFYLFLRLVFTTYRNPGLNQAVGLDTGFPLIGYRSIAQDLVLIADGGHEIASLVSDADDRVPDEKTAEMLTVLNDTLDEALTGTITAVTTPDYDATEATRKQFERVTDRITALNDRLDTERPEPLLALQRAVVLLERCARHGRDSLDVATHLAFRSDPDLVTTE